MPEGPCDAHDERRRSGGINGCSGTRRYLLSRRASDKLKTAVRVSLVFFYAAPKQGCCSSRPLTQVERDAIRCVLGAQRCRPFRPCGARNGARARAPPPTTVPQWRRALAAAATCSACVRRPATGGAHARNGPRCDANCDGTLETRCIARRATIGPQEIEHPLNPKAVDDQPAAEAL